MDATRAPQHHTATVNGIRMHYVTAGRGPAVLLLHGWPQTWYEWRKVMAGLAADFTVIAPDLRGFGYSAKPAAGYDAATYAADLAALCGHLGLAEVTVDLRWFFEHFAYDPSTISA
ncbi:MAG: alpha/beta fold hydrolase, partial [Actinomycetota bacterium]